MSGQINFPEILIGMSRTFPQMKRILRILFFAQEHHDQNEIHSSSSETPGEEAGSRYCFLGLPPIKDNPTAVVNFKVNFFHPPTIS